ncbi:MAG: hypothetical protein MJE68_26275 [Proteobacteria bacterium]|nr:hypothetical protein [Pseudomonadota bacterium]
MPQIFDASMQEMASGGFELEASSLQVSEDLSQAIRTSKGRFFSGCRIYFDLPVSTG